MATTDPTNLADRLAVLEARLASLKLADLPLAALQRKLENDWQPDGSVLLQPYSITQDQLALLPAVTSLPSNPRDGQDCFYKTSTGEVWHLRYNASVSKWDFVGGTPLVSEIDNDEVRAVAAAYAALGTAGPSITVPLAGDYWVDFGANIYTNVAFSANMSFDVGGTGAVDADCITLGTPSAGNFTQASVSRRRRKTTLAASTALVAKYKAGTNPANFRWRWMNVTPIRVG